MSIDGFVTPNSTEFVPLVPEEPAVTTSVPQSFDWSQTVIFELPDESPETVNISPFKPTETALALELPVIE